MNQIDLQVDLASLIRSWALERNLLKPGEVIEVTVRIVTPETVVVKVEGYYGPENPDQILLKNLDSLSIRTINSLSNGGIETVGQLRVKTEVEMLKLRNMGRKLIKEARIALQRLGIEVDWPSIR